MDELKNILDNPEGNKLPEDDKLMQYLNGELSPEEQHEVERMMADSEFMNDAIEGLQQMPSATVLNQYVNELNTKLQKQVEAKKQKKEKRKIQHLGGSITAVIILLLLCLLAYVVIRMLH